MITFNMASPVAWLWAFTATIWVWLLAYWVVWLIEHHAPGSWRALGYGRPWPTRATFLQLAHRLERLGIDLAERAGLIWPWPPSELQIRRYLFLGRLAAVNILPGDLLKLAGTGQVLRVRRVDNNIGRLTVAMREASLTGKAAAGAFRDFAKVWLAWHDAVEQTEAVATTPGRQTATGKRN